MPGKQSCGTSVRVVCGALFVLTASAALATSVMRLGLDQIRDRAGTIVVGTVAGSTTSKTLNGSLTVDEYRVAITETIRGARSKEVTVRIPRVDGAPRLRTASKYVFFLAATPKRPLVSMHQGFFRLENATVGGANATLLISGDNEPLVVSSDGTLHFGAPVAVANRRVIAMDTAASVDIGDADRPTSAEGVSSEHAPSSAVVAHTSSRRYATLSDLREFVRDGAAAAGRRTQ